MHGIFKIGIILTALVLLTPFVAASELNIEVSRETAIRGEQIIVTVVQDGTPLENVFLQFSIDEGTPIYAQTNATGQVVFKPEIAGTLKIVAIKDGELSASKYITVNPSSDDDETDDDCPGNDNGGTTPSIRIDIAYKCIADIYGRDIPFVNGMTVLDALDNASTRGGFNYNTTKKSGLGTYVYEIAGIEEKKEGPTSGWLYWVNEAAPGVGCADKTLQNGDEVIWFWSTGMDSVPPPKCPPGGSSRGSGDDISPTPTPTPAPTKIDIEAGENASVTFEKTDITRIIINANNTIHNAKVTIQQIEKPANVTNISGIPYRYFNVTTTNLTAADITNAIIEFRVNKTWLNESNVDETTIKLNRYSDINNNWNALPTSKVEEDNASLYFESETQGFSLFAISGEEKTAHLATEAGAETETETLMPEVTTTPTPAPIPTPIRAPASVPIIPMCLILIVIAVIVIAGVVIAVLRREK